jgi:hypothetical protein
MLTQLQITSAKPKAKPYNLPDGHGLVLAIQTSDSKLWRFRYRLADRQKTLHIGPWSATSLADAREKCREVRKAIAAGLDPALEKKREGHGTVLLAVGLVIETDIQDFVRVGDGWKPGNVLH